MNATPVIDRYHFHAVYFCESGGILFEVATNPPGFAVDEKPDGLGTHLVFPPWLESMRKELLEVLPPVQLPKKNEMQHTTEE